MVIYLFLHDVGKLGESGGSRVEGAFWGRCVAVGRDKPISRK